MPARKPQRARRRPVLSASAPAFGAPVARAQKRRTAIKEETNQDGPVLYIRDVLESGPEAEEARHRRFRRLTEEELAQCKPSEGSFLEFLSLTFPVTETERRYNKLFAEEEAKARASEPHSAKRSAKKRRSKARPAKKLHSKRSSKRSTSRD